MIRTVTRCAHCGALSLDGIEVDARRGVVRYDGREASVSPSEAALIAALLAAGGAPVAFERLHFAIWGNRPSGGPTTADNALKVFATRARRVFERLDAPFEIRALRTYGYELVTTEETAHA